MDEPVTAAAATDGDKTGQEGVRLSVDGSVATVTLCRPEVLNAQTPRMWRALAEVGARLPGDVRVVVVSGEGRAFSAGLDRAVLTGANGMLADLVRLPDSLANARIAGYQAGFSWLRRPDLLSIAAVRGHAVGAGFQLALACDLRVVAEDTQFTMAEVSLGLVPDLGGTKRLVELVGYARALEICVTGRRVDAAEAFRMGLANLVVAADDLPAAVADLTAALLSAPRDAVIEVKALLAGASERSFAQQEAAERAAQLRRLRDLAGQGE